MRSMASRVKRAPPSRHAAAFAVSRKKLLMFTVSGAPPPAAAESACTSARVASHASWSLVPQAKSRTSRATKCQVARGPPGAKVRAAAAPGVSTRTTRPVARAAARLSRAAAESTPSGFSRVPVAPTTQPCGTVSATS